MGRVDDQPESYEPDQQQPADHEGGGEYYYQGYDQDGQETTPSADALDTTASNPNNQYGSAPSATLPPEQQAPPPPSFAPQRPPPPPPQAVHFPPQSPQMTPPPQGQAYPPRQGQPQAYPQQQGQPQAYPPPQGQPQSYPTQQQGQPQAYPPHQQGKQQAYPPQPGQPQAYPPQQYSNYSHVQAQQQSYTPANNMYNQAGMQGTLNYQAQMGYQEGMPGTPNKAAPGFPMPQPVGTESWSSDLFDCMDDPENALITACFPCVTFGQIAEILDNGATPCATSGLLYGCIAFLIGCPCIMSCGYRSKLRTRYQLIESPAPDWMTHCFCEWCALCQEYRELKSRDLDPAIGWQGNLAKQQQIQMQQASMRPPMNQTMMG